jgi:hypothetical protein
MMLINFFETNMLDTMQKNNLTIINQQRNEY